MKENDHIQKYDSLCVLVCVLVYVCVRAHVSTLAGIYGGVEREFSNEKHVWREYLQNLKTEM